MTNPRIVNAARYIPALRVSNDDLSSMVETSDEWIYSRTGIRNRHISQGETASDMAAEVFRKLLAGTRYKADDIELLIISTVTPDYLSPHTSALTLSKVGATKAFGFDINGACTGFIYAFSVADKMVRSGFYKNAMVISSDTLSKVTDWTDRGTCVLFGDGAAGVLLEASDSDAGVITEDLHSDCSYPKAISFHRIPVQNAWHTDNGPLEPYLQMDGHAIFDFALREIPASIRRVLDKNGLTLDDIKIIIPHQANSRIIESIAKKLKTGLDKFFMNIHEYGNTSSASIPIAFSELWEQGAFVSGDKILFNGFGGGLTWGTILYGF